MKMTDAQNLAFMNNPERMAAQNRVKDARERVRSVQTCTSAQIILTTMSPALNELSWAYEDLQNIEARLWAEITQGTV